MKSEIKDNRKFAIYSRKSKFTGKGESIENQIELCRQYIRLHNPDVRESDILIYEDEGFSGGNTNRPKFKEMMSKIKANQIQAVVCYRLDRISRNVADFSLMYQVFDDMNVSFLSVSERYDTSTPSGRAMLSMCTVFAQMERETIAERIKDNMHELAKSGRWLGGTTPTGYKSTQIVGSVTVDGKERKAYKLDIVKAEAELVKGIFEKFLETNSLTKTETYLLQKHIKTKNGKDFTRFSIRSILANPVYMIADAQAWNYFESMGVEIYADKSDFDGKHGVIAYSKTIQKPGKANQIKDMNEWIIAVGKHEGLISGRDWVNAQASLKQNRSKSYHKPRSNVALLSGLLFCGKCGDFMRPKLSQRLNKDGEQIYSYLCQTKEKSRRQNCDGKNPNGNELDRMVCEQIKLLSQNHSAFIKGLATVKREFEASREDFNERLLHLQKEQQDNEKQINALVTALSKSDGTAAFDYITNQINELHSKNDGIKKQIADIESVSNQYSYSDSEFEILKDLLVSFGKSFDTMSVEQKRSALRTFIRRIVWDGENAHVLLFGDSEENIDISSFTEQNVEPLGADSE
ncbi:MAG: recombinase family protein [Clostridiales bacterium]|nr:recombinase family protein [Clostridiales bacterium]